MTPVAGGRTAQLCFLQRTTLSSFVLHPHILSGAPQFLLWKKYRAAVPHSSRFHQTPFRHPDAGRRAQVFPNRPSWDGGGGSLLPRVHLQPLPLLHPCSLHPGLLLSSTQAVPHPMQGGVGVCCWVEWRGSILAATGCCAAVPSRSPREPPGSKMFLLTTVQCAEYNWGRICSAEAKGIPKSQIPSPSHT